MFVKVVLHYGSGAGSHPLDLLLYDSQCWHCSITGECNAKENLQPCFILTKRNRNLNLLLLLLLLLIEARLVGCCRRTTSACSAPPPAAFRPSGSASPSQTRKVRGDNSNLLQDPRELCREIPRMMDRFIIRWNLDQIWSGYPVNPRKAIVWLIYWKMK